MKKDKKIFAFIDAENIKNAAQEAGYSDLNYKKICRWLLKNKKIGRVYLYNAISKLDTNKKQYFE